MYRLVFFGLPGAFSTIPLEALCRSGHPPVLVVEGLERVPGAARPTVEVVSGRPSVWDRLQSRLRSAPAPDAPPSPYDLGVVARQLGLQVVKTTHANDPKVLDLIRSVEPDAYVVAGFHHLLSPEALRLPRRGGLNLHPGALPQERGAAPLFWALREGRTELTWTIHVLDEGEDSGDVVVSGKLAFEPGVEGQALLGQLATGAAPHLVRSVRALMAGDLVRMPQPPSTAPRRRRPGFRDGRIDAGRPAWEVFTFVAGCARSYSLFAECANDRFFIRRAVSYDPRAKPDFEWFLSGDRLILRCRPGVVELELKENGTLFSAEYDEEPSPHRA
jgi:methionyl-tRNA formyltransferase